MIISSFDDDYDKDDKLDDDDDDEHNCSEFLKLILNLFLFTTFFKNKREAEETIYKKYLTTKKTRYVELMIIVDNVVVSEKKIKQLGNSRKYPYPTTDGFHVLTPPCLRKFQNALPPHALRIP